VHAHAPNLDAFRGLSENFVGIARASFAERLERFRRGHRYDEVLVPRIPEILEQRSMISGSARSWDREMMA
jgi:hypothetical protein